MDRRILDEKKDLLSTDYIPKYEQLYIHPEEGEAFRINDSIANIIEDINFIDEFIIDKASSLDNIIKSTVDRLNLIDLNILSEQERLQDIKMLCNKFTDFDNVIPINSQDKISGKYGFDNGTFFCQTANESNIKISIGNITGNGIEGNKYVYNNYSYLKDSVDTSQRANLLDNSKTSYWEYERISASPNEQYLLSDFNTDSEDAICTILLYSEKYMNFFNIITDATNISVIGVQYSHDGVNYTPIDIPVIKLNNKLASYDSSQYIYGDNKIFTPLCKYVKVTFQSSGTTDDTIAYDRVMFEKPVKLTPEEEAEKDKEDGIEGGFIGGTDLSAPTYNSLEDKTIIINSAKRRVIKINDIDVYTKEYEQDSFFSTKELITNNKYYAVAVFASVYLPSELSNDSVQFVLTINGRDYECIPINSKGSGKKIFRFSQGKSSIEYTELLSSPITSLYLTIKIKGKKDFSPYINNVKVLLGGKI